MRTEKITLKELASTPYYLPWGPVFDLLPVLREDGVHPDLLNRLRLALWDLFWLKNRIHNSYQQNCIIPDESSKDSDANSGRICDCMEKIREGRKGSGTITQMNYHLFRLLNFSVYGKFLENEAFALHSPESDTTQKCHAIANLFYYDYWNRLYPPLEKANLVFMPQSLTYIHKSSMKITAFAQHLLVDFPVYRSAYAAAKLPGWVDLNRLSTREFTVNPPGAEAIDADSIGQYEILRSIQHFNVGALSFNYMFAKGAEKLLMHLFKDFPDGTFLPMTRNRFRMYCVSHAKMNEPFAVKILGLMEEAFPGETAACRDSFGNTLLWHTLPEYAGNSGKKSKVQEFLETLVDPAAVNCHGISYQDFCNFYNQEEKTNE